MSNGKGFTLVEIVVVLVIMGILAAIGIPVYFTSLQQGAANAAHNNLVTIYNAEKNYYLSTTGNGTYCIAGCDKISDINLPANLNLNITDNNFTYACNNASGFTCTATNIADPQLILTVTNNPIIVLGGSTCASSTGANPGCNPSCASDITAYCPS